MAIYSAAVHDNTPFVPLAPSFGQKSPQKCMIKFLISKVALETFKQFSLEAILLQHLCMRDDQNGEKKNKKKTLPQQNVPPYLRLVTTAPINPFIWR